jgi:enterochelin esterase-like enzyme
MRAPREHSERRFDQLLASLLLGSWLLFKAAVSPLTAGSVPWVTPAVQAPKVYYQLMNSGAVGGQVSFHVYLPDAYALEPSRRFPVLYYLHGSDSVLTGIAAIAAAIDTAVIAGEIPPVIVVFPNGLPYGMWCNAESGLQPVESMVINDLIPTVDVRFRTLPGPRARIVEGFSMGGYGAARLGLLYPQLFGGYSMLAAGPLQLDFLADNPNYQPLALRQQILAQVYGNSLAVFESRSPWRLAEAPGATMQQQISRQLIGTLDSTLQPNRDFHQHLLELGFVHVYIEVPGVGHAVLPMMQALGSAYWQFHRDALRDADLLLRDGFES